MGHTIVFSTVGSYIMDDHTGESMALVERDGMYALEVEAKGFTRHGAHP